MRYFSFITAALLSLCLIGNAQAALHGGNADASHAAHHEHHHGPAATETPLASDAMPCLSVLGKEKSHCINCSDDRSRAWGALRLRDDVAKPCFVPEYDLPDNAPWITFLFDPSPGYGRAPGHFALHESWQPQGQATRIIKETQRFRI